MWKVFIPRVSLTVIKVLVFNTQRGCLPCLATHLAGLCLVLEEAPHTLLPPCLPNQAALKHHQQSGKHLIYDHGIYQIHKRQA